MLAAVAGLFTGSFLNVVIYRLPRSEGVFFGRSRCPACGRELSWPDLLPVISYLLLKGRCRRCGAPIAPRYLFVELLTACVFAWFYAVFGLTPLLGKYLLLASLLIAASFIDLEHYLIPDRLVAAGFLGGLALGFLPGDAGLGAGLEGAAAAGG
ncbi:MAG: prepilin peptidase, partial [Firmicutes bacterium]|nr:prepilin peptidase [Bacillota bacterium]